MKYCDTCHSTYPSDFSICPRDRGALRSVSDLAPGMTVRDRYIIVEKIGGGGMGTVYKARHRVFGELRALKLISPALAADPQFLERFETEAKIARRLQHPNAVRVDDIDRTEDGLPFLVMEYVEGVSLREVLEHEAPLPLERVLRIGHEAAAALAAAHQLGIVHRDIKPENILSIRRPDGSETIKVFDFGIAKIRPGYGTTAGSTPTMPGTVLGTPQYMSPEQAEGRPGDSIDGRADLYSLGVVLYEALTGRLPFEAETLQQWARHHLETVPVAPDVARPDLGIPPAVSAILMRALAKRPEERYASAGAMMAALDQAAAEAPAVAPALAPTVIRTLEVPTPEAAAPTVLSRTTPTPTPAPAAAVMPVPQPPDARPRSRKGIVLLIVAVVLAAIAIGTALLLRSMPGPPRHPVSVRFELVTPPDAEHRGLTATLKGTDQVFVLGTDVIADEKDIAEAAAIEDSTHRPALAITLTPAGAEKMRKASAANIGKQMGILVGGELLEAATIQSEFSDRFTVAGNFTREQVQELADRINGVR